MNHRIDLRKQSHKNVHLQSAWNKYGEKNFDFIIIVEFHHDVNRNYLLTEEQKYLDVAKSEKCKCYNLCFDASGGELTELSRQKISFKNRGERNGFYGMRHSDNSIAKMKFFRKNRVGKLAPNYGKKHSKETIERYKNMRNGSKNSAYDTKVYNLFNVDTNQVVSDTMFNLRTRFQFNRKVLSQLINGHIKSYRRWKCLNTKQ